MKTVNVGCPQERQRLFLCDKHKFIAFGGARGGGKSWAVRCKAILLAFNYPGIKIMIVRKTYPELRANHINQMKTIIGDAAVYRDTTKEHTFPNGSVILYRYCQTVSDLDKYQGTECDVLFLDEATQFTEEMYDRFKACVRGVNDFPKRIYLTCNPGGVGHGWVKRLFIDRAYKDGEKPDEYSFIRSLVTDNKTLMEADPEYIDQLRALPPKLRQAWLEGDWNIFDGQFFEEFRVEPDLKAIRDTGLTKEELIRQRRFTHVIEPFEIPDDWTIYRSFDWGYARPFSCGWWAVDHDGTAYRILELYGCRANEPNTGVKWTDKQVFSEIRRIETEHRWLKSKHIHGVADPAIWSYGGGESIAEVAEKQCVYFSPGDNDRIQGWMQFHYRMDFDDYGRPAMYVFSNCAAFIRTIPILQFSETKFEDLDTTQEDHVADEARYFFMARPIAPPEIEPPDEYKSNPMFTALDIPKSELSPPKKRKPIIEVYKK